MQTLTVSRLQKHQSGWNGADEDIITNPDEIRDTLRDLAARCYLLEHKGQIGISTKGFPVPVNDPNVKLPLIGSLEPISPGQLGDPAFMTHHGAKSAYMAGSMANAISGEALVSAMGRSGFLASFGSGGVSPARLVQAITIIKKELPDGPYAFNLIHSPQEPALEQKAVDLFLEHGIKTIEASAFLRLTSTVVEYRAAGLSLDEAGMVQIKNKIIAKVSRREVADQFLNSAPEKILALLVNNGKITSQQAELARKVPLADDITVEADSGGHTDNRPLVGLLPSLISLRNETQAKNNFDTQVRIGAGGGIGTPGSALAAFSMGAAYVVTGSVNQSCVESGTSEHVKQALSQAAATDVMMSPSADMFEMGVKVQVLKRGTLFPMRAQKLFDIYQNHSGINNLTSETREELEKKVFQNSLDEIWEECVKFFSERDPSQLEKAEGNEKRKMALIFRWYLGLATHWGILGLPERALDYQIWCGPSMGAFNDWVRGTSLEAPENRRVVKVAEELMLGAAYQYRLYALGLLGISVPTTWERYLER